MKPYQFKLVKEDDYALRNDFSEAVQKVHNLLVDTTGQTFLSDQLNVLMLSTQKKERREMEEMSTHKRGRRDVKITY